ncbi:hypothetical protein FF011L_00370 [Roseimaritima multifibrata]|uniref:Prepilin-type N-terminal cleavage/methylation domain-containing protein n=1 Tax=Roseimaritima multifibrata TaxID=1930274 RepID=A0A517M8T8_9BACT|nr:hypothetical protein [Roseimaritima multifibrata]QDS91308.1 hypothetical protein FF011L_00370 [Roseimaritima multifibrata]
MLVAHYPLPLVRTHFHGASPRQAFSLLEVIACISLVGIMLIPLAGMMRASAHAWEDVEAEGGQDADLRSACRWVQNTLRNADQVVNVNAESVQFTAAGELQTIQVLRNQLWLIAPSNRTLIADAIAKIECQPLRRASDSQIVAVDFQLTAVSVSGVSIPSVGTVATLDALRLR